MPHPLPVVHPRPSRVGQSLLKAHPQAESGSWHIWCFHQHHCEAIRGPQQGLLKRMGPWFWGKNPHKPEPKYIMATGTQRFLPGARGKKGGKPYDKVPRGSWCPWVNMPKCVWASLPSGRTEGKVFLGPKDTSRDTNHLDMLIRWWLPLTGSTILGSEKMPFFSIISALTTVPTRQWAAAGRAFSGVLHLTLSYFSQSYQLFPPFSSWQQAPPSIFRQMW